MSAYRDNLPADARAAFDAAIAKAAALHVQACRDTDELAATRGTRAVAEAAWYPGHPLGTVEAIQASYEALLPATCREQAA